MQDPLEWPNFFLYLTLVVYIGDAGSSRMAELFSFLDNGCIHW
jgi:hypothetical protein